MNTRLLRAHLHSSFCLLPSAWGQDYAIDWFTIDGGGARAPTAIMQLPAPLASPTPGS